MNTTNDQPAADYAALRTLADNQAEDIERLHAKIAALETQLEAHAWTVSPAMAQAQIDRLLADKARLDWLEQNMWHIWTNVRARSAVPRFVVKSFCGIFFSKTVRAAIDAASKEGQP